MLCLLWCERTGNCGRETVTNNALMVSPFGYRPVMEASWPDKAESGNSPAAPAQGWGCYATSLRFGVGFAVAIGRRSDASPIPWLRS
jgi:hypothetical protein